MDIEEEEITHEGSKGGGDAGFDSIIGHIEDLLMGIKTAFNPCLLPSDTNMDFSFN